MDDIDLQAYVASSLNKAGFKAGQRDQGLRDELIDTIYGTSISLDDLSVRVDFIAKRLFHGNGDEAKEAARYVLRNNKPLILDQNYQSKIIPPPEFSLERVKELFAKAVAGEPMGEEYTKAGKVKTLTKEFMLAHSLLFLENSKKPALPSQSTGVITGFEKEKWRNWDLSLSQETRGITGKTNLSQLFSTLIRMLGEEHEQVKSKTPTRRSGNVIGLPGIKWSMIDDALTNRIGAVSSLERELANVELDETFILSKTLDHLHETEPPVFPTTNSGLVMGAEWLNWDTAERFLLRRGESLSGLVFSFFAEKAREYEVKHGHLPDRDSGIIPETSGLTWERVDDALQNKGGAYKSSLEKMFIKTRVKEGSNRLSENLIWHYCLLYLTDDEREQIEFPNDKSGLIKNRYGETWSSWNQALSLGNRGLSGNSSLWLLIRTRLIGLAKDYLEEHESLPNRNSGQVKELEEYGVTWGMIDDALLNKGSHFNSCLDKLFIIEGLAVGPLEPDPNIVWNSAIDHLRVFKKWPTVMDQTYLSHMRWISWSGMAQRMDSGMNGFASDTALKGFLEDRIRGLSDNYRSIHGEKPSANSGMVSEVPGLSWALLVNVSAFRDTHTIGREYFSYNHS